MPSGAPDERGLSVTDGGDRDIKSVVPSGKKARGSYIFR